MTVTYLNEQMVSFTMSDLVNEKTVFFLEAKNKKDVLEELVEKAAKEGLVTDAMALKEAIHVRESLGSTAIGDGIAIPHAKLPGIDSFFVMTAVLRPAIDWDAPDQNPVNLVFLVGGPDNNQPAYLKLLGTILRSVKNADRKEEILRSSHPANVVRIMTQQGR